MAGPLSSRSALPRKRRRWPWIAGLLAVGMIAIVAWRHHQTASGDAQGQGKGGMAGGPVSVGVAKAAKADIPITLNALGTVTPLATAVVRAQVSGVLVKIGFREGQFVRKGDFLAQIDPRPFQAQLDQAEGNLARDEALMKNAQLDVKRYRQLIKEDSVAEQTLDTAIATARQYTGVVKADQALVETQRINLAYAHITSPIDGRVGLRQVDLGNYVTAGDTNGVAVVTQLEPVSVVFTLPEDSVSAVMKARREGRTLPVTALDRANAKEIAAGTLESIDNQIDTATGTVKLRALFANTDETLFPNQFVNMRLLVDTLRGVLTVPTAAIQQGTPGTFVYLVKDDHTVAVQKIAPGPSAGTMTSVSEGLKEGDTVVVDGTDKLKDGAKVRLPGDAPPAEAKDDKDDAKSSDGKDPAKEGGHHGRHRQ